MATVNTVRDPYRSATQPLIGMKTARLTRYEVSASLSASGLSPISAAIAGNDVVMTVESMFSMNSAHATMRGMRTALRKGTSRTGGESRVLPARRGMVEGRVE